MGSIFVRAYARVNKTDLDTLFCTNVFLLQFQMASIQGNRITYAMPDLGGGRYSPRPRSFNKIQLIKGSF